MRRRHGQHAGVRLARSAPAVPLGRVAAAVSVSEPALRGRLEMTPPRGECGRAVMFAFQSASRLETCKVLAHPRCPPQLRRRLAEEWLDRPGMVAEAARCPGVASWAARACVAANMVGVWPKVRGARFPVHATLARTAMAHGEDVVGSSRFIGEMLARGDLPAAAAARTAHLGGLYSTGELFASPSCPVWALPVCVNHAPDSPALAATARRRDCPPSVLAAIVVILGSYPLLDV